MFLLDTNVVSELRKAKAGKADPNLTRWVAAIAPSTLYVSAITLFELELGVLRVERRDATQGAILRRWLEGRVLPTFEGRVLPIDANVARLAAGLLVPDPIPERDALIAATALAYGMIVATRNVVDFARAGVRIVNPWSE